MPYYAHAVQMKCWKWNQPNKKWKITYQTHWQQTDGWALHNNTSKILDRVCRRWWALLFFPTCFIILCTLLLLYYYCKMSKILNLHLFPFPPKYLVNPPWLYLLFGRTTNRSKYCTKIWFVHTCYFNDEYLLHLLKNSVLISMFKTI